MDKRALIRRKGLPLFLAVIAAGLIVLGTSTSAAAGRVSAAWQQPTLTLTPTSGQFQFPTATATMAGGPTSTPTRTPTPVPVMAEIIGDPTNLRTGPGIDFDIIAELSPGITLPIIGRWLGYDWYLVAWTEGPGGQAWVYAPLVIVRGDITTVPAVTPPAPPTVDPAQAAIQATATVLLQTPGAAETATATAYFFPTGVFTQTPVGAGQGVPGVLPTFTPPPPYQPLEELPTPEVAEGRRGGLPPAVLIISLGVIGVLALALGLLRRLF